MKRTKVVAFADDLILATKGESDSRGKLCELRTTK